MSAFFEGVWEIAFRYVIHTIKIEPEVSRHEEEPKRLLGSIGFTKARYDLNFADTP